MLGKCTCARTWRVRRRAASMSLSGMNREKTGTKNRSFRFFPVRPKTGRFTFPVREPALPYMQREAQLFFLGLIEALHDYANAILKIQLFEQYQYQTMLFGSS